MSLKPIKLHTKWNIYVAWMCWWEINGEERGESRRKGCRAKRREIKLCASGEVVTEVALKYFGKQIKMIAWTRPCLIKARHLENTLTIPGGLGNFKTWGTNDEYKKETLSITPFRLVPADFGHVSSSLLSAVACCSCLVNVECLLSSHCIWLGYVIYWAGLPSINCP